jgi:hypothetical protein
MARLKSDASEDGPGAQERQRRSKQQQQQHSTSREAPRLEIEIVTLSRQGGRTYNEDVHGHWHDERYVACLVADGAGGHGGGDVAAATARSEHAGRLLCRAGAGRIHAAHGWSSRPTSTWWRARPKAASSRACARRWSSRPSTWRARRWPGCTAATAARTSFVAAPSWRAPPTTAWCSRWWPAACSTKRARACIRSATCCCRRSARSRRRPTSRCPTACASLPGDVLLLCSDGVWEPLGDECLVDTLHASRTPSQWTELLDAQIKAQRQAGPRQLHGAHAVGDCR